MTEYDKPVENTEYLSTNLTAICEAHKKLDELTVSCGFESSSSRNICANRFLFSICDREYEYQSTMTLHC